MEIPRAQMQRHHEQALQDPMYRMEGMMDVLREEIMMNMPVFVETEPPIVIPQKIIVKHHYIEPVKKKRDLKGGGEGRYIYSSILLEKEKEEIALEDDILRG